MIDEGPPGQQPSPTEPAAPPPVAFVKDLRVKYGKFEAVRGISFQIPKGEVFGFIGPNGAGKSSTIRVLATLQKEFEGTVRVNGISVRRDPDRVRAFAKRDDRGGAKPSALRAFALSPCGRGWRVFEPGEG